MKTSKNPLKSIRDKMNKMSKPKGMPPKKKMVPGSRMSAMFSKKGY